MTGHGSFGTYTERIGKTDGWCRDCGGLDTPEHALYLCERWSKERDRARQSLRTELNPQNTVRIMMESASNWRTVDELFTTILEERAKRERERDAADDDGLATGS